MGVDLADTTGIQRGTLVGHSLRALIAVHQGDLGTAEREVAAAEANAKSTGPQWRPDWMMWARALLLEADGRTGEALRTLRRAWQLCREAGVVAEYPVIGPDLVRLALAGGERELAEEVTAAVETLAGNAGVASVSGAALRCRGMVDADADVLLRAVAAYRRSPRRRELALTCEDAAAALAATGRVAEARPLAEAALDIYGVLEARWDASQAQSRFRAVGLRPGPRIERARPRFGWESLTQTEKRVASLVAEGLSNPDVARRLGISHRTVQSHVSHAFEKMGVSSRVELAVEVAAAQKFRMPGTAGGSSNLA